jgi:surface antigen
MSRKHKLSKKSLIVLSSIAAIVVIGGSASAYYIATSKNNDTRVVTSTESTLPKVKNEPKEVEVKKEDAAPDPETPAPVTPTPTPAPKETPKDDNTVTVEDIPHDLFGFSEYHAYKRRIEVGKPDAIKGVAAGYLFANAYCSQHSNGQTPSKYAIACLPGGTRGHMAFVEEVNTDGSIRVSEMNYKGYNIVDERIIPKDQAAQYRYIP